MIAVPLAGRFPAEYKVAAEAKQRIRNLCYSEMFTVAVAIVWGILPSTVNKPVRAQRAP